MKKTLSKTGFVWLYGRYYQVSPVFETYYGQEVLVEVYNPTSVSIKDLQGKFITFGYLKQETAQLPPKIDRPYSAPTRK